MASSQTANPIDDRGKLPGRAYYEQEVPDWTTDVYKRGLHLTTEEFSGLKDALEAEIVKTGLEEADFTNDSAETILGATCFPEIMSTYRAQMAGVPIKWIKKALFALTLQLRDSPPRRQGQEKTADPVEIVSRRPDISRAGRSKTDIERLATTGKIEDLKNCIIYTIRTDTGKKTFASTTDLVKKSPERAEGNIAYLDLSFDEYKLTLGEDFKVDVEEYEIWFPVDDIEISNERQWRTAIQHQHVRGMVNVDFQMVKKDTGRL